MYSSILSQIDFINQFWFNYFQTWTISPLLINFDQLQSILFEMITSYREILQESTKVWKSTKSLLGRARRNLAVKKIPCQIFLLSNDLDATRKKKRKIQSFSKNVLFATAAYQFRTDDHRLDDFFVKFPWMELLAKSFLKQFR